MAFKGSVRVVQVSACSSEKIITLQTNEVVLKLMPWILFLMLNFSERKKYMALKLPHPFLIETANQSFMSHHLTKMAMVHSFERFLHK